MFFLCIFIDGKNIQWTDELPLNFCPCSLLMVTTPSRESHMLAIVLLLIFGFSKTAITSFCDHLLTVFLVKYVHSKWHIMMPKLKLMVTVIMSGLIHQMMETLPMNALMMTWFPALTSGRPLQLMTRRGCGVYLRRQASLPVLVGMVLCCGFQTWCRVENCNTFVSPYWNTWPLMVPPLDSVTCPLSITSKALDVLVDGLFEGYDIGCRFSSTFASSSLCEKADQLNFRCYVDTFHGYSHNFACQVKNHPNIIDGTGLEDLEVMERIFGGSNPLAPVTHYAMAFQCHLLIDLYFHQWDKEKYQNLRLWLYNNYVPALKIIKRVML